MYERQEFELRKWQANDADSVAKYANNSKIADNLRNAFPYPYTKANAEYYIDSCISKADTCQYTRAIVVGGEAVGSIGVFIKDDVYCKSGEIGYWLGEPFWNRGIISSSIQQICHDVFNQYDIVRIFAEPFAHNIGSRKALEKAGFELEGILKKNVYKNGDYFDSCIYALLK